MILPIDPVSHPLHVRRAHGATLFSLQAFSAIFQKSPTKIYAPHDVVLRMEIPAMLSYLPRFGGGARVGATATTGVAAVSCPGTTGSCCGSQFVGSCCCVPAPFVTCNSAYFLFVAAPSHAAGPAISSTMSAFAVPSALCAGRVPH